MRSTHLVCYLFILCSLSFIQAETLPPLKDGKAPENFEELWAGFDPQKEALDTEVLKQWEEDGVILKVIRYRIGIFKGKKAMMAAVYGYPKGAKKLPGLVQIHGGGQYADHKAVLTNAKRGYVTISISWAGRISAPGYAVNPNIVKLFWDDKKDDPSYKVTTDWGALDGYHAPCRNAGHNFLSVKPALWTLDSVESPRNNSWFLSALGARRALTFLEQQEQVNPNRLGVYGHSMGGKLTVMTTASDSRVKAAAPSCGGISDRTNKNPLYEASICDQNYLKRIKCPIIFLSPSNDFHGRIDGLQTALTEIKSKEWRVTCSPHSNHQDLDEYEVATQLWFDQHLKKNFSMPETPKTKLTLKTESGTPSFSVDVDDSKKVLTVDVYYTQQGQMDGLKDNMTNTKNRFWHHAKAILQDGIWKAQLPIYSVDKPLWVYANVLYPLEKSITGAGYYYGLYTANSFYLSSKMDMIKPTTLQTAGVKETLKSDLIIEDFSTDWQKEWFTYKPEEWPVKTHKLYHPLWTAPENSKLSIKILANEANKLVIGIDEYAAEVDLKGGNKWQTITLNHADFTNASKSQLGAFKNLKEFRLGHQETLRDRKKNLVLKVGSAWKGSKPLFKDLKWIP